MKKHYLKYAAQIENIDNERRITSIGFSFTTKRMKDTKKGQLDYRAKMPRTLSKEPFALLRESL